MTSVYHCHVILVSNMFTVHRIVNEQQLYLVVKHHLKDYKVIN